MAGSNGRRMSRFWRNDEEMAKKDDDHPRGPPLAQWHSARVPRRRPLVRLLVYGFLAIIALVATVRSTVSFFDASFTASHRSRGGLELLPPPRFDMPNAQSKAELAGTGSGSSTSSETQQHRSAGYNGALKFPDLAPSLQSISGPTSGTFVKNRNVLFAAASLHSVAALLPMACQMAMERENYVHFAFMGRSDVPIAQLFKINGVDPSCSVIPHDARVDHSMTSADSRLTLAAGRALSHIYSYVHPQAVLVDSTSAEENFFLPGIREQATKTRTTLIELPGNPEKSLSWVTRLDSAALAAWNNVRVDILIQAPPTGSGNLKRLLASLYKADLSAMTPPHLTIELPFKMEPSLVELTQKFHWPPPQLSSAAQPSMLTLRHRIPRKKLDADESSARFLESYWPAQPENSHVLILSPHTEVTPQFFHYVKYSLLRYRYSNIGVSVDFDPRLMGLGFSSPEMYLDGTKPFTPPQLQAKKGADEDEDEGSNPPFMWQAPSSDAMLIFGERWKELHNYVSKVLEGQEYMPELPVPLQKKISKQYPAWLEYVLQLSRLRGYFTLYPGKVTAKAILGVHTDLKDVPEEYKGGPADEETDEWLADYATESFDPDTPVDMLAILPNGGVLPPLEDQPLLSWDGNRLSLDELRKEALRYTLEFRRKVGRCDDRELIQAIRQDAHDLFCFL